jgi:nucleoside-triphosphatase THEP1
LFTYGVYAKLLQIRGEEAQYKIDHHVTTGTDSGEGAFKSEATPDICKVVVEKGSKRGYVEITGGGLQASFVRTSPEKTGYEVIALQDGQRCMIYGSSTVVYIRPRS